MGRSSATWATSREGAPMRAIHACAPMCEYLASRPCEAGRPLAKQAGDLRADRPERVETRLHWAYQARLQDEELLVELGADAPPLAADGRRPPLNSLAAAGVQLAVTRAWGSARST